MIAVIIEKYFFWIRFYTEIRYENRIQCGKIP